MVFNPQSVFLLFSSDKSLKKSLKTVLGFYPGNVSLYKKAFRHRSAADTEKDSNERLEYLGDAVFGAVVAHYLFKKFPYKDEGFLTKMRSRMVNREYLNHLAKSLGIDVMVEYQADKHSRFKSLHGNAFEALIGAIYLDKGFNFTRKFIISKIIKYHIDMEELESVDLDFKSQIINLAQREKRKISFIVEEEIGTGREKQYKVAVVIDNEVAGRGIDFSKKRAEQLAAQKALENPEQGNKIL